MGSPPAGEPYWQRDSTFTDATREALHCALPPYFSDVQYGSFSSVSRREKDGYEYAEQHLGQITADCDTTTHFRFVTHSMGAAFGEGMARCLADSGYVTDVIVHFEPYQAGRIRTIGTSTDVLTIDFKMEDDPILRLGSGGDIEGADIHYDGGRSDAPAEKKHRYPISHSATWEELQPFIDAFLGEEPIADKSTDYDTYGQ